MVCTASPPLPYTYRQYNEDDRQALCCKGTSMAGMYDLLDTNTERRVVVRISRDPLMDAPNTAGILCGTTPCS